jgi:hypothetical protein
MQSQLVSSKPFTGMRQLLLKIMTQMSLAYMKGTDKTFIVVLKSIIYIMRCKGF